MFSLEETLPFFSVLPSFHPQVTSIPFLFHAIFAPFLPLFKAKTKIFCKKFGG